MNDFEDDPFGDGYTKEIAKKEIEQQGDTCILGDECESCGS